VLDDGSRGLESWSSIMNHRSFSLAVYRFSRPLWTLVERSLAAVRAFVIGLWLGLLGRQDLHQVDLDHFDSAMPYASEEYNCGGLFPWEELAVKRFFDRAHRVVVVGAGAGREVMALCRRGIEVDGFEFHPSLREIGDRLLASQGLTARLRPMGRDLCPELEGPYDGLIVGWANYTLIPGRATRVRFLEDLRAAAAADAPLLVSAFSRHGDERSFRITRAVAAPLRRLLGGEPVELGDHLGPNYVHCFTRAELTDELAQGGFQLLHFEAHVGTAHAVARAI
jgi:hypothetical protein